MLSIRVRISSFLLFFFFIIFLISGECATDSKTICSKKCVAENCNSIGIRYGKYCGVGWTGCPGEKPCDDLDACCQIHDDCVGKKGMTDVKCHEKFKRCIKKVQKSGKVGFSRDCPYDAAVPIMEQEVPGAADVLPGSCSVFLKVDDECEPCADISHD